MSRWCCQERWAQDFVAQRMQLAHEAQECTVAEARPWKSMFRSGQVKTWFLLLYTKWGPQDS